MQHTMTKKVIDNKHIHTLTWMVAKFHNLKKPLDNCKWPDQISIQKKYCEMWTRQLEH